MKIAIASDHAGFKYKTMLIPILNNFGHGVVDFGTYSNETCDYPDYIRPAAEAVARGDFDRGIVLGGSGNGEAIVANRIHGIRCALCWNTESARLSRSHNDSNILALGERMLTEKDVKEIVEVWLNTPFDGGRHLLRIGKIDL